ncbi:MAG: hypothetical protein HYY13_12880 [Nitrospirae bacterium]|nr:hypothetical protein [Nitrospirota bacterium]
MRTTIEIPDSQRAKLVELAAQRREKGFSRIVQEALDRYLAEHATRSARVRAALEVLGALDPTDADALADSVTQLRSRWR